KDANGTPGAFRTNAQTAAGGIRSALGLGRKTRDRPASALGANAVRRRIWVVSRIRDAEYGRVAHGRIAGDTPAATALRLTQPPLQRIGSLIYRKPLMIARSDGRTPERQPTNRTGQLQSALAMCGSEIAQCRKGHYEREKVANYLLNAAHPDNGGRAAFFEELGFRRADPETLAKALQKLAHQAEVTRTATSSHGQKYVMVGQIKSPVGKAADVQTIWIVDK